MLILEVEAYNIMDKQSQEKPTQQQKQGTNCNNQSHDSKDCPIKKQPPVRIPSEQKSEDSCQIVTDSVRQKEKGLNGLNEANQRQEEKETQKSTTRMMMTRQYMRELEDQRRQQRQRMQRMRMRRQSEVDSSLLQKRILALETRLDQHQRYKVGMEMREKYSERKREETQRLSNENMERLRRLQMEMSKLKEREPTERRERWINRERGDNQPIRVEAVMNDSRNSSSSSSSSGSNSSESQPGHKNPSQTKKIKLIIKLKRQ